MLAVHVNSNLKLSNEKMLQMVKKFIKEEAARQFKVDTRKTCNWLQQKECLVENKKQRGLRMQKRLDGPITDHQVQ